MSVIFAAVLPVLFTIISINRADTDPGVTEVALCDTDDSGLCVVTFGANTLDRMVIHFQLPDADYPLFYVKASNRGIVNVYSCEVVEAESASAYCTGVRTPLGEAIAIEVYATDGDTLMANGTFMVSAIVLSTSINLTDIDSETETLTPDPSFPIETEIIPTPTSNGFNQ